MRKMQKSCALQAFFRKCRARGIVRAAGSGGGRVGRWVRRRRWNARCGGGVLCIVYMDRLYGRKRVWQGRSLRVAPGGGAWRRCWVRVAPSLVPCVCRWQNTGVRSYSRCVSVVGSGSSRCGARSFVAKCRCVIASPPYRMCCPKRFPAWLGGVPHPSVRVFAEGR